MSIGFFEEREGQKSMMRRMSWWLLMFFLFINAVFGLVYTYIYFKAMSAFKPVPEISNILLWIECVLLLFCFAPKAAQKLIEMRFGVKADEAKTTTTTEVNIKKEETKP